MGRPRKLEQDDRYNEEALSLVQETQAAAYEPEADDVVPELGELDRQALFESLDDEDSFDEGLS